MKKIILLLPLLFITAIPLMAQPIVFDSARNAARGIARNTAGAAKRGLTTSRGSIGRPVHVVPPLTTTTKIPKIVPPMPGSFTQNPFLGSAVGQASFGKSKTFTRNQRPFWERWSRNVKASKLKKQHAEAVRRAQLEANLPRLEPGETFSFNDELDFLAVLVPSFENFSPDSKFLILSDLPALPFLEEENVVYRGMALSPAQLKNIAENGILLKDVSSSSNRHNLAVVGGDRGLVTHFATHPTINTTANPEKAIYWGAKNVTSKRWILTVAKIKDVPQRGDIVNLAQDIPVEQIEELVVLLRDPNRHPNQNAWYRLKKETEEYEKFPFKFTAYEHKLPPAAQK